MRGMEIEIVGIGPLVLSPGIIVVRASLENDRYRYERKEKDPKMMMSVILLLLLVNQKMMMSW